MVLLRLDVPADLVPVRSQAALRDAPLWRYAPNVSARTGGVGIELGLGWAHPLEIEHLAEAVAAARNTRSNRRVLRQYENLERPTIGLLSTTPPIDPRNLASPKEKTPPSDATVQ